MRIHVVASGVDRYGGAEVYTGAFVEQCAELGHAITLICHVPGRITPAVRVLTIPKTQVRSPFIWRAGSWIEWLSYRRSLEDPKLERPDLIIAMNHLLASWHWRRMADVPVIYLPHSLVAPLEVSASFNMPRLQAFFRAALWRRLEREALRRAKYVVRFTQYAAQALSDEYNIADIDKLRVFPPPVDIPHTIVHRSVSSHIKLLCVGRLSPLKNVDFVIKALSRIPASCNWTLDIVGDGEQRNDLKEQVAAFSLGHKIAFHGHQKEVDRFYDNADLLLFPSRLESAGLVALEAMAREVPVLVIASDNLRYRTAAPEFINHNVNGFIAADEESFCRLLREIMDEPGRLRNAGLAARRMVSDRYSWKRHMECWHDLLESLIH